MEKIDQQKEDELLKENLSKKIAGEICLSESSGAMIKKWRNIMKISQRDLANEVDVMPSVISDYESGRRKSPGIRIVKKFVDAMIKIDEERGGKVIREFSNFPVSGSISSAIYDIREFTQPIDVKKFVKALDGKMIVEGDQKELCGYTVIDSLKAIINFSPSELVKIYGSTTERALIFTNVHTGRSPMIAIKVTSLKPNLLIFHGTDNIDEIAKRIAEVEGIPVAVTNVKTIDDVVKKLRKKFN